MSGPVPCVRPCLAHPSIRVSGIPAVKNLETDDRWMKDASPFVRSPIPWDSSLDLVSWSVVSHFFAQPGDEFR